MILPPYNVQFITSTSVLNSRNNTFIFSMPTTVDVDDTVLLFTWSGETNDSKLNTAALPNSWSLLSEINTPTRQQVCLLRHTVLTEETATYTFPEITTGVGLPLFGFSLAYRGLDPSTALISAGVTDITTNTVLFNCPSTTLVKNSDVYLGFTAGLSSIPIFSTPPINATERVDSSGTLISTYHASAFELLTHKLGTTGVQTVTLDTASTGVAASYALKAISGNVDNYKTKLMRQMIQRSPLDTRLSSPLGVLLHVVGTQDNVIGGLFGDSDFLPDDPAGAF